MASQTNENGGKLIEKMKKRRSVFNFSYRIARKNSVLLRGIEEILLINLMIYCKSSGEMQSHGPNSVIARRLKAEVAIQFDFSFSG